MARFLVGVTDSCLNPKAFRRSLDLTHPPIHFVPEALSSGIQGPGYGAEHSLPTCAEFKNEYYTSTPHIACTETILPLLYKKRNSIFHEVTHKTTNEVFKLIKVTSIQK